MVSATEDDILRNSRTLIKGLEALRDEHMAVQNGFKTNLAKEDASIVTEKQSIVERNLSKLDQGIEEAQVMTSLVSYLQILEAEKLKLRAMVGRMQQEMAWLQSELAQSRNKNQESATRLGQLEVEMEHLSFMNSLKKYDDPNATPVAEEPVIAKSHAETLQELGFGPEEDDGSDQFASPSSASALAASATGGIEVSSRLKTIYGLVLDYTSSGRYEVAIPLCKQTLEEVEKEHGHNHPDVATMLNILALAYRDQKKFTEAASLLTEALAVRESCLGETHSAVPCTLNNLAVLYGKRGRFKEAEPHCRRALQIKEKMSGPDSADVAKQLNNLALLCINLGNYEEADTHYRRAMAIYEARLGPNDPNVGKTKSHLASSQFKQGKIKEAETLFKEILTAAHEREFGKISDKNQSIWQIAEKREEMKARGEQLPDKCSTHEGWLRVAGAESVRSNLKHLGAIYRQQGKYEAADTLEDVAMRAKKQGKSPSARVAELVKSVRYPSKADAAAAQQKK